ncbi:MAG: acyl-CoA thioesterase [Elainellaceae cyanobacterium]
MDPELPTQAIQNLSPDTTDFWFDYPVHAHPHQTDYAGVVWHGSYVAWMEEARIECLRSLGIEYADLVAMGCELPVVELSIRYHRALHMGMDAIVRTRIMNLDSVRLNWDYRIQSRDQADLYATAQVSLVAVDREKGKIMRQLPPAVKHALMKMAIET